MKKILAGAIVALAPVPAMAADGNVVDGYGSFSMGYHSFDQGDWTNTYGDFVTTTTDSGTGGKADGLDLEARASVAVPLGGRFAAQVDGVFARTNYKQSDCSGCSIGHLNTSTVAVHAFTRNPGHALVGVIVQRSSQDWNWGGGETTYYFGGEGQLHFGQASVTGQVAYGTLDGPSWRSQSGVNAALQLRVFPKDNLGLALRGGYERLTQKPGGDSYNCPDYCYHNTMKAWEFGGKAEYRLPSSRLSLLADVDYRDLKYHHSYIDKPNWWSEGQAKFSDIRMLVGIKINFGAGSLRERDRSGASLDPLRSIASDMWSFEA